MKRFLLPAAIIVLMGACVSNETADSKDVNQSQIYQTYRYSWSQGSGSASASFRFGGENGTTLRFDKTGAILYNGTALTETKFLLGGAYYSGEETNYSPVHTWKFKDENGKVYENAISFERVEFKNPPHKASRNGKIEISLTRAIDTRENIMLEASCDTLKATSRHITNDSTDLVYFNKQEGKLVIRPEYFEGFNAKIPATVWLSKSEYKTPLEQPTGLPGEMHFDYESQVIEINRR